MEAGLTLLKEIVQKLVLKCAKKRLDSFSIAVDLFNLGRCKSKQTLQTGCNQNAQSSCRQKKGVRSIEKTVTFISFTAYCAKVCTFSLVFNLLSLLRLLTAGSNPLERSRFLVTCIFITEIRLGCRDDTTR